MQLTQLRHLNYEELISLRARLFTLCRRAFSEYTRNMCTGTYTEFSQLRDAAAFTEIEIERREEMMLEMWDIRTVLHAFEIPFTRRKGNTYIL